MLDRTDAQPLTAGAWLRQQREAADISLEALSVALKVRPSRLQALESDQLSEMPDDLFVRSLALGICRHLKANEHALLPLLPQSPQRDLRVGRNQIHANPYNPNRWTGPMLFSPKRWPFKWFAGGVAMALSGLLWLVWPDAKVADLSSPLPVPVGATNTEAAAHELRYGIATGGQSTRNRNIAALSPRPGESKLGIQLQASSIF
jgi:cytoskeleton protein RodZ